MRADKATRGDIPTADYRRYLAALTVFHLAAAEATGLTGSDYQAVNVLDLDGPLPSGELARRLGLTTGATTRLVDRLVSAGLAERQPDSDDRRRALVAHTGALPPGLGDILGRVQAPIGAALAALTPEQRAGVGAYLRAAADAYGDAARALSEQASRDEKRRR